MASIEKGETGYENRFRNRPISSGRDLSCYGAERLPALHSLSPAAGRCWTVHGCPLCLALPVGDLRVSGRRRRTSTGQSLRTVGGGGAGAGDCQHPYFPRLDGPERASVGPLRGSTVGRDLHRRATGLFRVVPVALAAAGLTAGERNKTWPKNSPSSSQDLRVNKAAPSRGASLSEATRSVPSRATQTRARPSRSRTPGRCSSWRRSKTLLRL